MSFKSIVRELWGMRDNFWKKGLDGKNINGRARSHIAPESYISSSLIIVQQSKWANLPSELLLDIIKRVEATETSWPARRDVVACAAVCRSWREITKEVVRTPEQCGWLTFPLSLKQVSLTISPKQLSDFFILFHFHPLSLLILYFIFL